MSNTDPHPGPAAPATDLWDWHYSRSLDEGIDSYDAEILADSYVERYLGSGALG